MKTVLTGLGSEGCSGISNPPMGEGITNELGADEGIVSRVSLEPGVDTGTSNGWTMAGSGESGAERKVGYGVY